MFEDCAVPGHWECALIAASNNRYIATLVERHSRYVMLTFMAGATVVYIIEFRQVKRNYGYVGNHGNIELL
jgi:IS30 family transposase